MVPISTSRKSSAPDETKNEPPNKKKKNTGSFELVDADQVVLTDKSQKPWLTLERIDLTETDKTTIIAGKQLTDLHINFAQELLKMQFPLLTGLQSTLIISEHRKWPATSGYLQIMHTRGNHWIVVSNIGCSPKVQVFDSLYSSIDDTTVKLLTKVFGANIVVEMGNCPQQKGTADCGVFAIATCIALANGKQPGRFLQEKMS